jgi:hypothetical protein
METPTKRRQERVVLSAAILLAALSCSDLAAAEVSPKRLQAHLDYDAPADCPTRAELNARILGRTALAEITDAPSDWTARLELTVEGNEARGHLLIEAKGAPARERTVVGETCADVVDALALVTALAIDPNASWVADAALIKTVTPPVQPAPIVEAPAPKVLPSSSPISSNSPVTPAPPRWQLTIGGAARTSAGLAPDPLLGGALHAMLQSTRETVVSPALRLSATVEVNGAFAARAASFLYARGEVDLCPLRLGSSAFDMHLCGGVGGGVVRAVGIEIAHPILATPAWVELDVVVTGRWHPGGGAFFLEADVAALVPLTRRTFVFNTPHLFVYHVAAVAPTLDVGAGVRF